MNKHTPRSPGALLRDSAVCESLLASLILLVLSAGLIWVVALLWVWRWMLAGNSNPTEGLILVFGHQLHEGRPSPDFVRRLDRAAELAAGQPGLRLMLLGGGQPSEAATGRDWLVEHTGLDPGRIELEEESTDSLQNLRQARDLIDAGTPIYLLSSRYHLGRLRVLANQVGMRVRLVPAERRIRPGPADIRHSMREAAYVCWFVCGRFWARLARRHHLLERLR